LLPSVIKIDPYCFELYRFKVDAFFSETRVLIASTCFDVVHRSIRQTSLFRRIRSVSAAYTQTDTTTRLTLILKIIIIL